MLNNLNLLFFFMMIISSLISISSSNWLGAWMGLEINMLSFIPLITNNKNILSNESALKYFLIQTIASCSFLTFCLMNSFHYPIFSNVNTPIFNNILLTLPLIMKLGATPFQSWFIMVMEGLTWTKCIMLLTWQKLSPLFITFYIVNNKIIMPFCIASLIVGSISGLNQTSIKKIMAYSSVNHSGWLLSSMIINKYALIFYFTMYFFLISHTVMNFMKTNMNNFNQLFLNNKLHLSLSLLSLGGLPPLLGFLPKWIIINNMISMYMYSLCSLMIMTTLITTFFYMRMIFSSIIMSSNLQKYSIFNFYPNMYNNLFILITCTGLYLFNLII